MILSWAADFLERFCEDGSTEVPEKWPLIPAKKPAGRDPEHARDYEETKQCF